MVVKLKVSKESKTGSKLVVELWAIKDGLLLTKKNMKIDAFHIKSDAEDIILIVRDYNVDRFLMSLIF